MPIDEGFLYNKIKVAFPDADIELKDMVGDGDHYSLKITSKKFNNVLKVEQHRLVHKVLKDYLGKKLHAISIQTYAKK